MNRAATPGPGATRACPHCREIILQSAAVCPSCRHYLRFDTSAAAPKPDAFSALRIEGSIRHPAEGHPWEYTVVVTIHNERNEEVAHKLIGVGAMSPNQHCTFTLSVEAVPAKASTSWKSGTDH